FSAHPTLRELPSFPTRRSSDLQPEHLADAKIIGEYFFQVGARKGRVALLYIAEQTFFRGQQESFAIDLDAAAFQDDADTIYFGRSEEHTSELQSRFDLVCRLLL